MNVRVYYDGQEVEVAVPTSCTLESIEPMILKITKPENEVISESLVNPISSPSFEKFVSEYDSFLLIVNDGARATPTPRILKQLLPYLKDKNIGIIVACGTHKPPSENEIKELILGEFYATLRKKLVLHDSRASDNFITVGTTSRGTTVRVNPIIDEYDAIIAINSIEPHYFAGFTGGRKSFLPGISAYESVEMNHSMALLDESHILSLKGNPLHEDLEEAVHLIIDARHVFAVNVVLDGSQKIVGSFAGNIFEQVYEGAELAKKVYAPIIKKPPDILISVVHAPLDQNLYQAQKGFENCLFAVKPGGIMILVASCYSGIGPEDYVSMLQSSSTPKELAERFEEIKKHYELGWHKVGSIPTFLKDKQLWMVTKIPNNELERMFIRGFDDVQAAIDEATKQKGQSCQMLVVHDSANVCPVLKT